MVSCIGGDRVLPTRTLWWVTLHHDSRETPDRTHPQLQDPHNNVIAFVRPTRPTRFQGLGDVYAELHFVRSAGAGVVVCPVRYLTTNNADLVWTQ
jgi:hypothetical protein